MATVRTAILLLVVFQIVAADGSLYPTPALGYARVPLTKVPQLPQIPQYARTPYASARRNPLLGAQFMKPINVPITQTSAVNVENARADQSTCPTPSSATPLPPFPHHTATELLLYAILRYHTTHTNSPSPPPIRSQASRDTTAYLCAWIPATTIPPVPTYPIPPKPPIIVRPSYPTAPPPVEGYPVPIVKPPSVPVPVDSYAGTPLPAPIVTPGGSITNDLRCIGGKWSECCFVQCD
ncbi:hypothetical protein OSTOST_23106 [Ostertagia ostertagi]